MAKGSFTLPDWTTAPPPPSGLEEIEPPRSARPITWMTRVAPGRWVWTEPGYEGIAEAIDRAHARDPRRPDHATTTPVAAVDTVLCTHQPTLFRIYTSRGPERCSYSRGRPTRSW